jgi:hypothetical protein
VPENTDDRPLLEFSVVHNAVELFRGEREQSASVWR